MNIREVAKKAGTSYTTVSRVLNNSPLVADKTKDKILSLVKEMGYQINDSARSLATGIRMTVGVMYPYSSLRQVESLYTTEVIHSLREELRIYNFDTMITGYDSVTEDLSGFSRLVRQKKVDGLIIIGSEISRECVEEVAALTGNIFLINPARSEWSSQFSRVLIDDYYGGTLVADEFIKKGINSVSVMMQDTPIFTLRYKGFSSTLLEKNPETKINVLTLQNGSDEEAYNYTTANLNNIKKSEGLFVLSDKSAFGVMNALQDNGIKIPEQISVIGYDNVESSRYCRPTLSTIHQPRSQVVKFAAEFMNLCVLQNNCNIQDYLLKPRIVKRKSF